MTKPKLKLDFTDFGGLNKVDNWFTRILSKDFVIEISDKPDLLIFQEGGYLNRLYTCKNYSGLENLSCQIRVEQTTP